MNFQTSCMVLVTNEQQQIEIEKWIISIGWRVLGGRKGGPRFLMADTDENAALWLELDESAQEWFGYDFYDCGENIEMFKALAAMNDENMIRQLVVDDAGNWGLCHQDDEHGRGIAVRGIAFNINNYHKATKEEIIEHFKNLKA